MSPNGRNDCENLKEGFNSAIYALSRTRTGKQLIEAAYKNSRFSIRLVMFDDSLPSTYPKFDSGNNELTYDPFTYGSGVNPDGSSWRQSGIGILAHELAHHMLGNLDETQAIAKTNQVLQEVKAVGYSDASTLNRVGHGGQIQSTSSVLDASWGLHPPCNNPA